ncbi:MAG: cytochrome c oxidase subunit 3 [Deltaproteobacteria bacterium]|nr:cytochrome c oxidase subunit 3 [Deltaproteobacteria bacterium]
MTDAPPERDFRLVHPAPRARRPVVPSEVFAMLVFVFTEVMFFGGLASAHTITRSNWPLWPPPGQPRLPIEATALNTAVLLASGALLWLAGRRFAAGRSVAPLHGAMGAGLFFVAAQGYEWVGLVREGLTMQSSTHGAFFYLIVGTHALHVLAGLGVLVALRARLAAGRLSADEFTAGRIFWYFVVLLWPVLYWRVYL